MDFAHRREKKFRLVAYEVSLRANCRQIDRSIIDEHGDAIRVGPYSFDLPRLLVVVIAGNFCRSALNSRPAYELEMLISASPFVLSAFKTAADVPMDVVPGMVSADFSRNVCW